MRRGVRKDVGGYGLLQEREDEEEECGKKSLASGEDNAEKSLASREDKVCILRECIIVS